MTESGRADDQWFGAWDKVKGRIILDWMLHPEGFESAKRDLLALDPTLRQAFFEWLDRGTIDLDFAVEDCSIRRIIELKGPSICAAFTWLDGLIKTPEETKKWLYFRRRFELVLADDPRLKTGEIFPH